MRIRFALALFAGAVALSSSAGQQPSVTIGQLDESTYRYAVTAERRQIVAANIGLVPPESERFWRVYEDYEKERAPLDKERFDLLSRYAQSYAAVSDAQAMGLVTAASRLQLSEIQLRIRYADILSRKLSGRVGARFFQIDDYVTTAHRLNSLQGIPLTAPAR